MKLNNTFVLFDVGNLSQSDDWQRTHQAIESAVKQVAWPIDSPNGLVIPKRVRVMQGASYIDEQGETLIWAKAKPLTLRNGVVPLKQIFRTNMEHSGWRSEEKLTLGSYFNKIREDRSLSQISRYPEPHPDARHDPLHEKVGDFDFWLSSETGFRTVIEWETGNVSSSHRSLNKICLALMAGIVDAAVVIVPSHELKAHLTDRVGNIKELQPYFYSWSAIGRSVKMGLLAVMEVEHDGLFNSTDERDFIPQGNDGNAVRKIARRTMSGPTRRRGRSPGA